MFTYKEAGNDSQRKQIFLFKAIHLHSVLFAQHPFEGLQSTLLFINRVLLSKENNTLQDYYKGLVYRHIFDLSPMSLRWLPKSISHRRVLFISAIHQVMGRYNTQQDGCVRHTRNAGSPS